MSRQAYRTGVFTPVVLMVLTVFAILGVTYSFTGSSSYSQSAQVIQTVKAGLLAQAALEEAQMVIYDKVNRPAKHPLVPEWRKDLLKKVQEEVAAKATGTGPIKIQSADTNGWINLLQAGMVEKIKTLATELGGEAEITEVKVKFYGFRKIPYNEKGDTYKAENVYKNELIDKDVPDYVPNDFIGYYTIRATAKSRNQTKSFAVTHDIKIVNCAPMAHDFGVFQMQEITNQNASDTDLNGGGAWRMYPRGFGRAYMRGPYTVESEGLPGGEGGKGPADPNDPKQVVSNSFLKFVNDQGNVEGWSNWHMIPNPRAGIVKRAALFFGKAQMRPYTASTGVIATVVGVATNNVPGVSAGGSIYTELGADPGLYIPENQTWYTGFKDPTGKEFSLCGEPRGDFTQGFGFSCYRGEQFRLDSNSSGTKLDSKAFWPADELNRDPSTGVKPFEYVGQYMGEPPSTKDGNWYIVPEAFLKLKCHVVRFKTPGINLGDLLKFNNPFNFNYSLVLNDTSSTPGGVATQLYGLHWEPVRERGILDSVLDGLFAITPGFLFLSPAAFIFNLDIRGALAGNVPGTSEDFKDVRPKSLPTNYKGVWSRAATRVYKKYSRMKSVVEASKASADFAKVMLDGVLWSGELKLETPIQYTGKGILGAEPPDGNANEAVLTGPVIPVRDRIQEAQARDAVPADWKTDNARWNTENYLTVIWQGQTAKAFDGNQMLALKLKNVGSSPLIDGTLFSTHGVKPDAGATITLNGNLVCGVINKSKIPTNSTFILNYNDRVLSRRNDNQGRPAETPKTAVEIFTGGDWHNCAVSPRISGYIER